VRTNSKTLGVWRPHKLQKRGSGQALPASFVSKSVSTLCVVARRSRGILHRCGTPVPWRSHRCSFGDYVPLENRFLPPITAPLCQGEVEITLLRNVFGLLEEVDREESVGVEDLDADEAVRLPIEGDPGFDAGWRAGFGRGVATRELLFGEVDINGVGLSVMGDAHGTSLA
jgi:hypothetical protein